MFRSPQPGDWASDDEDQPLVVVSEEVKQQPKKTNAWAAPSPTRATESNTREDFPPPQRSNRGENPGNNRSGLRGGDNRGFGRDFDRDRGFGRDRGGNDNSRSFDRSRRDDYRNVRGDNRRERDNGSRNSPPPRGQKPSSGGGGGGGGGYLRQHKKRMEEEKSPRVDETREQGVVLALKDNFGFVSCADRDGDLFFHHSETYRGIELGDEVEFFVVPNRRNEGKFSATRLTKLDKGTIKWEEISDETLEGVVVQGLQSRTQRRNFGAAEQEERGFIELIVEDTAEGGSSSTGRKQRVAFTASSMKTEEQSSVNEKEDGGDDKDNSCQDVESKHTEDGSTDTVNVHDGEEEEEEGDEEEVQEGGDGDGSASVEEKKKDVKSKRKSKPSAKRRPLMPRVGDTVSFRVSTSKKTRRKSAVDLTITRTAVEKRRQDISHLVEEGVLEREEGMVVMDKKLGRLLIRSVARRQLLSFDMREPVVRNVPNDSDLPEGEVESSSGGGEGREVEKKEMTAGKKRKAKNGRGKKLKEGEEVRFYVLTTEALETKGIVGMEGRTNGATAVHVEVLGKGSVYFHDVIHTNLEGCLERLPGDTSRHGSISLPSALEIEDGGERLSTVPISVDAMRDIAHPLVPGDVLRFDYVADKIDGWKHASNVTVVQLNPKLREQGRVVSVKADKFFGFIRCCNRDMDAYFHFTEAIGFENSAPGGTACVREGMEVEFDAILTRNDAADSVQNCKANRVMPLAKGTISFEKVVHERASVKLVAHPRSSRERGSTGQVSYELPESIELIEFFPHLKHELVEFAQSDATIESSIRFDADLSVHERAAVHAFCDKLGLAHESCGEGRSRRIRAFRVQEEEQNVETPAATATARPRSKKTSSKLRLNFHMDDVEDVRFLRKADTGAELQCEVVLNTRTRVLEAKRIVNVVEKNNNETNDNHEYGVEEGSGEGMITAIKDSFGFITASSLRVADKELVICAHQQQQQVVEEQTCSTDEKSGEKDQEKCAASLAVVPDLSVYFTWKDIVDCTHDLKRMNTFSRRKAMEGNRVQFTAKLNVKKNKWCATMVKITDHTSLSETEGVEGRFSGFILEESKDRKQSRKSTFRKDTKPAVKLSAGKIQLLMPLQQNGGSDTSAAEFFGSQNPSLSDEQRADKVREAQEFIIEHYSWKETDYSLGKKSKGIGNGSGGFESLPKSAASNASTSTNSSTNTSMNTKDETSVEEKSAVDVHVSTVHQREHPVIKSVLYYTADENHTSSSASSSDRKAHVGDEVEFSLVLEKNAVMGRKKQLSVVTQLRAVDIKVLNRASRTLKGCIDDIVFRNKYGILHEVTTAHSESEKAPPSSSKSVKETLEASREDAAGGALFCASNKVPLEANQRLFSTKILKENSNVQPGDSVEFTVFDPPNGAKGIVTSVRKLQSSSSFTPTKTKTNTSGVEENDRKSGINKTLLRVMRESGAKAVVRTLMAQGPDGTKGFKDGWRVCGTCDNDGEENEAQESSD